VVSFQAVPVQPPRRRSVDGSVPKISEFYGVVIRMYYGEHNPPHFHADYAGDRASLDFPKP